MSNKLVYPLVLAALSCISANYGAYAGEPPVPVRVMLHFNTMYAVDGPFLNSTAIRDVPGDEAPWVIRNYARGVLFTNGQVIIHVRGLVFPDRPNDEATFRGLVSCLSEDEGENIITSNVMTRPFPTGPEGNADIIQKIALPNPCIAPIMMIMAGSEDKWFAVTGFEAEEDEE